MTPVFLVLDVEGGVVVWLPDGDFVLEESVLGLSHGHHTRYVQGAVYVILTGWWD